MSEHEISADRNGAVATAVREHLARRHISRQRLADEARISISTLEKALNGSRPFTLATLVRLETVLGASLRPRPAAPETGAAPEELGGYGRAGVAWLEGEYRTLRPSFEVADAIYAYRIRIAWDDAEDHLTFEERERLDAPFSQRGVVSLPAKSGHIYLHTNVEGQMQLAILGRPAITAQMYGVLTTLASGSGSHLLPVAAAIALIPLGTEGRPLGRMAASDPGYAEARAHLARITDDGFARLIVG